MAQVCATVLLLNGLRARAAAAAPGTPSHSSLAMKGEVRVCSPKTMSWSPKNTLPLVAGVGEAWEQTSTTLASGQALYI